MGNRKYRSLTVDDFAELGLSDNIQGRGRSIQRLPLRVFSSEEEHGSSKSEDAFPGDLTPSDVKNVSLTILPASLKPRLLRIVPGEPR